MLVSRKGVLDRALILSIAWLTPTAPLWAWGTVVHQRVISEAIDTLPKPLKVFYKAHRLEIPILSVESKPSDEGQERRFAVDRLLPFPFTELPHTEAALQARFGEAAGQAGRLPWLIRESFDRLVQAFRQGDKTKILGESDSLGGLVTDLHNPLALTDNADGQKTGQHGLWVRFSIRLAQVAEGNLKLNPDAAHLLDDPNGFVFSMINGTYVWLDNLLYEEELAHRGQSEYTEIYYDNFEQRVRPILRARLSRAAGDVGSYWYTAWTAAGRPALP